MSVGNRFSAEEWDILSALPSQAAIAAAVSDGVTVIGTIREIDEGNAAMADGAVTYADNDIISAILAEMSRQTEDEEAIDQMIAEGSMPPPGDDPLELPIEATEPGTEITTDESERVIKTTSAADAMAAIEIPEVDPRDPGAYTHEVVANATQARQILSAKSTPEEAGQYTSWVLDTVERVINRSKSGGFLGIGGERVGEDEAKFLSNLTSALRG